MVKIRMTRILFQEREWQEIPSLGLMCGILSSARTRLLVCDISSLINSKELDEYVLIFTRGHSICEGRLRGPGARSVDISQNS